MGTQRSSVRCGLGVLIAGSLMSPDQRKGGMSMAYDWHKSSRSGNGGNCVEIAVAED
jgi:hypothetical protein